MQAIATVPSSREKKNKGKGKNASENIEPEFGVQDIIVAGQNQNDTPAVRMLSELWQGDEEARTRRTNNRSPGRG